MKTLKNKKIIYVSLSIAALILNALPFIFRDDAALTAYSFVSIAFAICSIVYASIGFMLRDKGNLFLAGKHWYYRLLSLTFSKNKSYTEDAEYKKEFELSAFIFCVTIPTYITLAFFAVGFYSAISQAVSWTIVRSVAIIMIVIIPRIIKAIKAKNQQRLRDDADRKEQERLESMGKWK